MFLLEPGRTQFDLNWRMWGIAVRVHPMFWLVSAILGWNAVDEGFQYLVLWIACVFVSILVHEMGHVLMGRVFGTDGHIVLYSLGGLAVGSNGMSSRWQRIAVSFGGPLAGFLFLGAILVGLALFLPDQFLVAKASLFGMVGLKAELPARLIPIFLQTTLLNAAVRDLIWINLYWGLVNLLPIWPLDGGQISRELFTWMSPANGVRASLTLSGVVAGAIAVNVLATHFLKHPPIPYLNLGEDLYLAVFFGLLALQSFMSLQTVPRQSGSRWQRREEEEQRLPWERDPDYWKSGRGDPWE